MLKDRTLFGTTDKEQVSINRIQQLEPEEGYLLVFSGGKDSTVVEKLADMAEVDYEMKHQLTTVGPPEQINFIRDNYPECEIMKPEKSMWELIPENVYPPTRLVRYCCRKLKEYAGEDRVCLTGVRAEESQQRAGRKMTEACQKEGSSKRFVNPIIDWTEEEVWQFIEKHDLEYCELYDEGYNRIGCIGCPFKSKERRLKDFERYPKYKESYLRAFKNMIEERKKRGLEERWESAEEVMHWWIYEPPKEDENQIKLFQ